MPEIVHGVSWCARPRQSRTGPADILIARPIGNNVGEEEHVKLKVLLIALAVLTMSSTIHADSCSSFCLPTLTWIATEQALEVTANAQVYAWAFLGSTDFNVVETFQRCRPGFPECTGGFPGEFVGSNLVFTLPGGGSIRNVNPFVGDGLAFDDFVINFGARFGCSSSDIPPCELGVVYRQA